VSGVLDEKASQRLQAMQPGVKLSLLALLKQYQCRISLDLHVQSAHVVQTNTEGHIPLRYPARELVRSRFEAGRRPAAS